jgi:hypothetical protein
MTAATAALVLSLMGQATQTLYAEQAKCAGVTNPKPLPAIRVVPREKFWCGPATEWLVRRAASPPQHHGHAGRRRTRPRMFHHVLATATATRSTSRRCGVRAWSRPPPGDTADVVRPALTRRTRHLLFARVSRRQG